MIRPADMLRFAFEALSRYRLRSGLILLAMSVGVAAVIVLTALGEGARRYVQGEFNTLGSNLLMVLPGRSETKGGPPPMTGETPNDLTLADAEALLQSHAVKRVAPLVLGQVALSYRGRERQLTLLGSSAELLHVRQLALSQGRFLGTQELDREVAEVVIGGKTRDELFGSRPALGEWLRINDSRFRVVGVLASKGQSVGFDMDDVAIIPVASAMRLMNTPSLFQLLLQARSREHMVAAKRATLEILAARHNREEDVTVITQDAVLSAFDDIFLMLTLLVAGIGAISLVVAAVLIMNVTLVAVSQRTAEIGLLKALGATRGEIRLLFLVEAGLMALLGASLGAALGEWLVWLARWLYPLIPFAVPLWALFGSLLLALLVGISFALLPAGRAAKLDPVVALSRRE